MTDRSASLVRATGPVLTAVLDETYPIWGEGLTRRAYGAYNHAQMETAWGRTHLQRLALVEGETVLASAKRYDLTVRSYGTLIPTLGIGAVFTPPLLRGKGHAKALVDALIDDARARGCELALLFSEIGADYYARLGFQALRRDVSTIEVLSKPGAPAQLVRAGEPSDFPWLVEILARAVEGASFALEPSADWLAYALTRRRLQAGFGPSGEREVEFFVTEEGSRAVAFVVITRGPKGRVLELWGDRDPSGARVGAMLQVLAARTPAEQPLRVSGWISDAWLPPQVRVIDRHPAPEIMMARRLDGDSGTVSAFDRPVYWTLDTF
jgi:GNAT superfamily N-acetyltransferase